MNSYRALIVDDEIKNVAILKHFVSKYCLNVEVIGEALTLSEAVSEINFKQPDILFLDIRLNEGDAFDILDQLEENLKAQVIFVTSYNEYATKAFRYNAIDYILKPIAIEEVILAVNKAIKNIEQERYFDFQQMAKLFAPQDTVSEKKDYIAVTGIDSIDLIKASNVSYIEAEGRYSHFHLTSGKKLTASRNLLHFENYIDKSRFFRIHNSYIVNIEHLVKILKTGGSYCEMTSGKMLPVSKRRLEEFSKFLNIKY